MSMLHLNTLLFGNIPLEYIICINCKIIFCCIRLHIYFIVVAVDGNTDIIKKRAFIKI